MDQKGTVVVLEQERKKLHQLESDLKTLGYRIIRRAFPTIKISDIIRLCPVAVFFGLTEWDNERSNTCEMLLDEGILSRESPVIALISEKTMKKISPVMEFDDYIVFPCTLPELEFRLGMTIYRRLHRLNRDVITIGDISVSQANYEVRIKDKPITMTLKEYQLFRYLFINRGRVFTRDSLLTTIWGFGDYRGTRTIDVHIRRIRAKIDDIDQSYIKTVRGVGYTFRNDC